jgi:uncharacterized protein (TIGR03437 family)
MRLLISLAIVVSIACGADFTTYIGDANEFQVAAITADAAGNTYATGSRIIQLPAGNSATDVFVTKLDATGNIVFSTTFGGKGSERGNAIAVDPSGDIWVGGSTSSPNFPLHDALQIRPGSGNPGGTGFLVKLAPDGTVIYSSYFGGLSGASGVNGVATDQSGNVYVTGATSSSDFPTTAGLPAAKVTSGGLPGIFGAFVTKLDAAGLHVIYSTLIAGNSVDCSGGSSCFLMGRFTSGVGIAVDTAGDAVVAGNTNTTDLPVTSGGVTGYGAFAAKIEATGNQLLYLTYLGPPAGIVSLGPSETINATAIAVDTVGNAYLTGSTNDSLFPATNGAYQGKLNADPADSSPPTDAFALKLSPSGTLVWATYLGGAETDFANSISVDGTGDLWLAGDNGAGFPSGQPGFVATAGDFLGELSPDGSQLVYSAEFPVGTTGQSVATDANGLIHVAGSNGLVSTVTPAQPLTSRIWGITNAAAGQVSGRIAPGEVISIFGFGLGPTTPATATPSNGFFPMTLGGVQVLVNGVAIPLLYVSASQINAEIPAPFGGVESDSAVVQVINGSEMLPDFRVSVDPSIFGVFLNPDRSIAAINQDGTLNSASNPAKAGTIVSMWATGFSASVAPMVGAVATAANNWCSYCQISVGFTMETVAYAGAAPGVIDGVMQINFLVPSTVLAGVAQIPVDFAGLGSGGSIWVAP